MLHGYSCWGLYYTVHVFVRPIWSRRPRMEAHGNFRIGGIFPLAHVTVFFMEAERLKFKVVLAHRIFQLVTHYYGQKSAAMLTVVM